MGFDLVLNGLLVIIFGASGYCYAQFSKRAQRDSDDLLRYGTLAYAIGLILLFYHSGLIQTNNLAVLYGFGAMWVSIDACFFLQKRQYILHYWLNKRKKSSS